MLQNVVTMLVPESSAAATPRVYAAQSVFDGLAADILRGALAPRAALPSERELAERFGVSNLIVRQAIHRLAEAGLVDVRKGGTTRARDPQTSGDLRVIELYYRLAPERADDLARDVLEKQFTQGLSLVEVFARRASGASRAALVDLVEGEQRAARDSRAFADFETRFWTLVATGGMNRILMAETRWWYTTLVVRPSMPSAPPLTKRFAFYRELGRQLGRAGDDGDAVRYYMDALTPAIEALREPRASRTGSSR
jgi:GntR family transcriptional repressor for pyruvate dehydrogenase complex